MTIRDTLAENFATLRMRHSALYKLTDVAKAGAGSNGTLNRVLNKQTGASIDLLEQLAGVYNVAPWQLVAPALGAPHVAHPAESTQPISMADRRKVISIAEVVHWLASAAETMDATTRGFVGDSLKAVLLDPSSAQFRADQLTGLLAVRPDIAPGAPKAGSM